MRNKLLKLKDEYRLTILKLQQTRMSTPLQTTERQTRIDQAYLEGKIDLIDDLLRTDLKLNNEENV